MARLAQAWKRPTRSIARQAHGAIPACGGRVDRLLGELEESGLQITKAHWDTPAVLQAAERDQAGARLGNTECFWIHSPRYPKPVLTCAVAQSQRAKEGDFSLARRRMAGRYGLFAQEQETSGCLVGPLFVETVETQSGVQRIQRNIRLGDARQLTKPLAKRALREHVDAANNYQPQAMKVQQMGKGSNAVLHVCGTLAGRSARFTKRHPPRQR